MKKLLGIVVLGLLWCNVVNASVSLKCENVDPKATLEYARVQVDLNKKRFYYHWLGGYMTITAVTPDRINAILKIPDRNINWYAILNRYSGNLEVYNDRDDFKGVTGNYKCKKVDKLL